MRTPICDFVREYAQEQAVRLHMPGHKGKTFLGLEHLDITEIDGADVLYHGEGIIRESEKNASLLFDTAKTLYSTEGSSLSIRAMLYLAMLNGQKQGERSFILAGRNAHKAFMSAVAVLDLDVEWLYPEMRANVISCEITPKALEETLDALPQKPIAVYITSPDYLGNMADIRGLSYVCHQYGVPLLLDHAHGAYLHFLPVSRHAIAEGADLCCDSAHKTLSGLTGAGYLHVSKNAPELFADQAERAMALFASTSPSYLILQSLDLLNRHLSNDYSNRLLTCCERVEALKNRLSSYGYPLVGDEPLKLTLSPKSFGYTGEELARILANSGIVCEFYDGDFTVMMVSPEIETWEYERVEKVLTSIPRKESITDGAPSVPKPQRLLSLREALFSDSEILPISQCNGRILADVTVSCPPAIPIVACGEKIDEHAIRCFHYYGISACRVVKEEK